MLGCSLGTVIVQYRRYGTDEVRRDVFTTATLKDIIPKLLALRLSPRGYSLTDGNDKLVRLLEEIEELGFGDFHNFFPDFPLRVGGCRFSETAL